MVKLSREFLLKSRFTNHIKISQRAYSYLISKTSSSSLTEVDDTDKSKQQQLHIPVMLNDVIKYLVDDIPQTLEPLNSMNKVNLNIKNDFIIKNYF